MAPDIEPFGHESVQGFLHRPEAADGDGVVLTHGAGSNCESRLLITVADALCGAGFHVLRCDLPFRQQRPNGPPIPAQAAADRAGLRAAVEALREFVTGRIVLGGHSYGGRQSSMLAAEDPKIADCLLLLSYPLHPPRRPNQLRTAHLPDVQMPALFVHGTRDPFGSPEEMKAAVGLLSGPVELSLAPSASHDLASGKFDLGGLLIRPLQDLFGRH
jgi:uncharacterized protein